MARVRRAVAVLVAVLAVLAGLLAVGDGPAVAVDGYAGPDETFAEGGRLALDTASTEVEADGQGRLLVLDAVGATGRRLRRFAGDGTPDAAFGAVSLPAGKVATSSIRILPDGTISVLDRPRSSVVQVTPPTTVVRVGDDGTFDASYGTDGTFSTSTDDLDPVLELPDGALLVAQRRWGFVLVTRYDLGGHRDPGFGGGDGAVEVVCCGPDPSTANVVGMVPDVAGTGAVLLLRQAGVATLVRLAVDGTTGPEVPFGGTGFSWGLRVLPSGHPLVMTMGDEYGAGPERAVRLLDDLTVDPAFGGSGYVSGGGLHGVPHLRGDRLLLVTLDSGSASILALGDTGIDRTYGTAGVASVPRPPAPPDSSSIGGTAGFAIDAEGRAVVSTVADWGPGFFNPYSSSRSSIVSFDADGGTIHRWDWSGSPYGIRDLTLGGAPSAAYVRSWRDGEHLERWVLPDPAATLGPVRELGATTAGQVATASWRAPQVAGGLLVAGYRVRVVDPGAPGATGGLFAARDVIGTSTSLTLPLAAHAYRVEVQPVGIAGTVGPSTSVVVIPPVGTADRVVQRLSVDVAGRAPTAVEVATSLAALADGATTPDGLVVAALRTPDWSSQVDPVVRLYLAHLQRAPDLSGLRHWAAKRRAGTTVAAISASFAASSEFRRTYGALDDRAYVELVYRNVLGRAGDPSGIDWWTRRLTARRTTRGQVMASFSESAEHVRTTRAIVDVVGVHLALLARMPSPTELADWTGVAALGDAGLLARVLLGGAEYRGRLP